MSLPPQLLEDKYEVLSKIKEGGMGSIYKVRHVLLDQIRVVKVIRQQHAEDAELRERFYQEALTTTRLRHPGIAQIHDLSVAEDGTAVLVMEYIDGFSLKELLQRDGRLELGLALETSRQALDSLEFLHQQGYVHRDISPDNLMVTRTHDGQPKVKLIDLGIAKRLGGDTMKTQTGAFLGKARYAAPEQFGADGIDARADIYAFGVVLYELLTGRRPIEGDELSQLVASHLFREPLGFDVSDPEGRVPEELRQVILQTLAKEPDQRPPSAAALAEQLAPFAEPFLSPFGDGKTFESTSSLSASTLREVSPLAWEQTARINVQPETATLETAGPGTPETELIAPPEPTYVEAQEPESLEETEASLPASSRPKWLMPVAALAVVLALALILFFRPKGVERQDPGQLYSQALTALEAEDWRAASTALKEAVATDPEPRPGANDEQPYLPYFQLGRASFGMKSYVAALEFWEKSEGYDVVQGTPSYQDLEAMRGRIGAVLESQVEDASSFLLSANDYGGLIEGALADDGFAPILATVPEFRPKALKKGEELKVLNNELLRLRTLDLSAGDVAVAREVTELRQKAAQLKDDYMGLADELDAASTRFSKGSE